LELGYKNDINPEYSSLFIKQSCSFELKTLFIGNF
jgi:hypothetical protein